jgi:hypothetical protein
MRKVLTTIVLSLLFLSEASPALGEPAPTLIKVLQVTSERVCVPQVPGDLESGILCGEGFRVVAESKQFYIEAVMLAALANTQPVPSVGTHFAGIVGGNFLSILDSGNAEKARIVSSLNIEVLKPKQESKG